MYDRPQDSTSKNATTINASVAKAITFHAVSTTTASIGIGATLPLPALRLAVATTLGIQTAGAPSTAGTLMSFSTAFPALRVAWIEVRVLLIARMIEIHLGSTGKVPDTKPNGYPDQDSRQNR